MQVFRETVPLVLYLLVAAISLQMAAKGLLAGQFLPFHERIAGKRWADIDSRMRLVIILLLRVSGLGFLAVALVLGIFPLANYFLALPASAQPAHKLAAAALEYGPPAIAIVFCLALAAINYRAFRMTGAGTPWRELLFAAVTVALGLVLARL